MNKKDIIKHYIKTLLAGIIFFGISIYGVFILVALFIYWVDIPLIVFLATSDGFAIAVNEWVLALFIGSGWMMGWLYPHIRRLSFIQILRRTVSWRLKG